MRRTTGRVLAIAIRSGRRMPMQEIASAAITVAAGVAGDHKGAKFPRRAVTLLAIEDWQAALLDLSGVAGPPDLAWTARRANILIEGLDLRVGTGSILRLGTAVLEVTYPTTPCARMDEALPGLRRALASRGGVTARVVEDGDAAVGDAVEVLREVEASVARLPG